MFEVTFFKCRLFKIVDNYVALVKLKTTENSCQIKLELNFHNYFYNFSL